MNWYLEVLKKYAVFDGRARRKEYWFFILFNILISIALGSIDRFTGNIFLDTDLGQFGGGAYAGILGTFSSIYALGVMIPSIAVSVRRLHDTGRSGWWVLINFVPVIADSYSCTLWCLTATRKAMNMGHALKASK